MSCLKTECVCVITPIATVVFVTYLIYSMLLIYCVVEQNALT